MRSGYFYGFSIPSILIVINFLGGFAACQSVNPPARPDTTWWIGAPKTIKDVKTEIWIGLSASNSSASLGSRENPYTGSSALADAFTASRKLTTGPVGIFVDVPKESDNIGFPSFYNSPYGNAGIKAHGGFWTLFKKVGKGKMFVYPEPGTNYLAMGQITPSTYHSTKNLKLVIDGLMITSQFAGKGTSACMKRASIRLSLVQEIIFRNCEIYRNSDISCNLHVGGGGILFTYASRVLLENSRIASTSTSVGNGSYAHLSYFGDSRDIVIRNNYFYGADPSGTGKWDYVGNFWSDDKRLNRVEVYGNVFSLARRKFLREDSFGHAEILFLVQGSDIDFHHNIIIQRPAPLGAKNFRAIFRFAYDGIISRIAIRNNLFLNPNGTITYALGYVHDLSLFNNVFVNSTKTNWTSAQYISEAYEWTPTLNKKTSYRPDPQGPTGHDYNVYYAWSEAGVGYAGNPVTDQGFSATWTPALDFKGESHSYFNNLHPGLKGIATDPTPFNSASVDISPGDNGPITYKEWVDHFRPLNDNLKTVGTGSFYGTNYASSAYNRDIDGNSMVSDAGAVPAGPYGFGDGNTLPTDISPRKFSARGVLGPQTIGVQTTHDGVKFYIPMERKVSFGKNYKVSLLNAAGKLVFSGSLKTANGAAFLNLKRLPSGLLFFKIDGGGVKYSGKFLNIR